MKRIILIGIICTGWIGSITCDTISAEPIVNVGEVVYVEPDTGAEITRESLPAVINGPYLTVTKKANKKNIVPGEEVEYVITVKNIGTKPARNVRILDRFPDELKYIGARAVIYDEQGNVIEEGRVVPVVEDIEKAEEGAEIGSYKGEHFSISIKKGSTIKEMFIRLFGPGWLVMFFQTGSLY
jgi:uncharacterized repeat protein (TIGR01451 family)